MNPNNSRIPPELLEIALNTVEGFAFERFSNEFLSAVEGRDFTPLGGIHDGGADGFKHDELYETEKAGLFYQITVQKNHREKIRKTVSRLNEFGRTPRTLYYVTSRQIPHIDQEEDNLSEDCNVIIKIRDKNYIISHINQSIGTINAFNTHLARYTDFLARIGQTTGKGIQHVDDPSVYVFLQHEISNRLGDRKLIHSITDTLILWALRDTDPDLNILLGRGEIYDLITASFPWAKGFLNGNLDSRLNSLRTKDLQGRQLRWYKKQKKYCLPHETRNIIKNENIDDEALKIDCSEELQLRASELCDGDDETYELLADLTLKVVEEIFQKQGLLLSHFIANENDDEPPFVAADCINNVVDNHAIPAKNSLDYKNTISLLLNSLFYNSSPKQRIYLHYLSRTYVLLFTLKAEPRIIDYFSTMGSNFRLFVGTDILIKALSERFVKQEDQRCRNTLKAAADAGMNLCLSSCVLDEIHAHIKGTYWEFKNHIAPIEPYLNRDIIRNCNKILIRAYFYAKDRKDIRGWKAFMEQFISYENITNDKGREELSKYLISEFRLTFYENSELEAIVDKIKVDNLAHTLLDKGEKENLALAHNSALLVHGIYGLRSRDKESMNGSPFGFNTWWLTSQKKITKHTYELVKNRLAKYIMRPEFVLNYLSLAPSCEQVRETYKNVFPSTLGIELGHRLNNDVFHQVLGQVGEWKEKEPGRINSLVSDLSDQLKSDQFKVYEETVETMEEKLREIGGE